MLHRCQRATQGPVGDPVKILTAGHHGPLRWRSGNQTWLHDGEKKRGFLQGNFGHVHSHVWLTSKCKWNIWSWASKLRTHCGPHWQQNFELLNRRKCRTLQDSIWKPEHMKPLLSNPTGTGFNFETSCSQPPETGRSLWKTWVPWVPTRVPTRVPTTSPRCPRWSHSPSARSWAARWLPRSPRARRASRRSPSCRCRPSPPHSWCEGSAPRHPHRSGMGWDGMDLERVCAEVSWKVWKLPVSNVWVVGADWS